MVSQEKWGGRLWCWWENPTSEGQGKFFPLLEDSFGIHWLRLQRGIMELWQGGQRRFKEMRSMCCLHIFESAGGAGRHGGGSGQWDPAGRAERGVRRRSAPHRRVGFRQQLVRDRLSTGLWLEATFFYNSASLQSTRAVACDWCSGGGYLKVPNNQVQRSNPHSCTTAT